ncbi:uncharacterized protein J3D65DRAFT_469251 [Phyllosticta citribraziliensis]|uniref:Secreted protein n=1 Tax=Phyllosticta citribraziliensis TaxID=989973 RepID=A0ABR1LHA2_9PEZI
MFTYHQHIWLSWCFQWCRSCRRGDLSSASWSQSDRSQSRIRWALRRYGCCIPRSLHSRCLYDQISAGLFRELSTNRLPSTHLVVVVLSMVQVVPSGRPSGVGAAMARAAKKEKRATLYCIVAVVDVKTCQRYFLSVMRLWMVLENELMFCWTRKRLNFFIHIHRRRRFPSRAVGLHSTRVSATLGRRTLVRRYVQCPSLPLVVNSLSYSHVRHCWMEHRERRRACLVPDGWGPEIVETTPAKRRWGLKCRGDEQLLGLKFLAQGLMLSNA